jgi:hypothetical protein
MSSTTVNSHYREGLTSRYHLFLRPLRSLMLCWSDSHNTPLGLKSFYYYGIN